MWSGGSPCGTNFGNNIASSYTLTNFRQIHAIMGKFGHDALHVLDLNNFTISSRPFSANDDTIRRGEYGGSFPCDDINSSMKFSPIRKGGAPVSKAG